METKRKRGKRRQWSPTQTIVFSFFAIVLIGSLLLSLPFATESGKRAPYLTAAFTSVSATCVTGLVLEDTATYWSNFGEAVILCLIQIGGLGLMTMAILLSLLLKRAITPKERVVAASSFNLDSFSGIVRFVRRIARGTALIEVGGAALLSIRMIPLFGIGRGIWLSVFHAVSAFCNAGFDLMGSYSGAFSSLTAFRGDWLVNLAVMSLIVLGGIGFVVWDDVYERLTHRKKLSAYTRFVLLLTAVLIVGGAAAVLGMEWSNPATLGGLPVSEKILASFFQSVTVRTAGFNTLDLGVLHQATLLVLIALMFIGGASGSTAGGIKVGTIGLVLLTVRSTLRGREKVVIFNRDVSPANILRAYTITVIQFAVTVAGGLVLIAGGAGAMSAMFEVFSASATVGLSLSLTPQLGLVSHLTLMLMMFFGRVGILTVTYAIMLRFGDQQEAVSHPEVKWMVG